MSQVAAGAGVVIAHFARSAAAAVSEDQALIEALGISFVAAPLDTPLAPAPGAGAVSLVYQSSGEREQAQLGERLRAVAHADRLLVVALDAAAQPAGGVPPGLDVLVRRAPLRRYRRMLLTRVLELLERSPDPGSPTDPAALPDDAATRILPRALKLVAEGSEYRIPPDFRGLVTVGRSASCQLSLDSSFVSRLHGCLRVVDGRYRYRDLSTNGTLLLVGHDETLLCDEEVDLPDKGMLRLGDVTLSFEVHEP